MKATSKVLAAALTGALLLSALAGCGDKPAGGSSATEPSGSSTGSAEASKPMDIKWLSFYGPENNDSYPQQYLEEKYNVKLNNMIVDRNQWDEQLNVKLAGGEIPDVFWTWGSADVNKYQKQGVLAEIPLDLIKEKMPVYSKSVDEIQPNLWYNTLIGDKNYGVPLYWSNGAVPQSPVYNKAWLDKVGAQVPKTLDEFVDVLTKFTNEDPDGNGKKDTYGISFRGKDAPNQTMMQIYWAFGVPVMDWVVNDEGTGICMSFQTQAWKDATAMIQKLFKDGVIDPESITDDNALLTQKFANGRTGIVEVGNFYHWLKDIGAYRIAADNAGIELAYGHLPVQEGYARKSTVMSGGVNNSPVCMGVQVEKDAEKMGKILEIFEDLHSDEETYLATVFGKEGEHYTMVDGTPVRDAKVGDPVQQGTKFGIGTFYGLFGSAKSLPMTKFDYTKEQLEMKDLFLTDTDLTMPAFIGNLPSNGDYPDLTNQVKEFVIKSAIGEVNLEQDLEAFRTQWLANGGEVLSKEANELYTAQNK